MTNLQNFPDKEPVRFEDPNEEIDRMIEEKIESDEHLLNQRLEIEEMEGSAS